MAAPLPAGALAQDARPEPEVPAQAGRAVRQQGLLRGLGLAVRSLCRPAQEHGNSSPLLRRMVSAPAAAGRMFPSPSDAWSGLALLRPRSPPAARRGGGAPGGDKAARRWYRVSELPDSELMSLRRVSGPPWAAAQQPAEAESGPRRGARRAMSLSTTNAPALGPHADRAE
ncbi:unnamed protein product, partial [Prorocentrum cordatum]